MQPVEKVSIFRFVLLLKMDGLSYLSKWDPVKIPLVLSKNEQILFLVKVTQNINHI